MAISNEEHVALLNKALQAEEEYADGMRFFSVPKGESAGNADGYDWEPRGVNEGLFQRVAGRVLAAIESGGDKGNG
jgi:hypothetical protein